MSNQSSQQPVRIDGALGEGGGQVLRSALTLSLATGRPVEIANIRAGRAKPGLRRQHLTAVQAAAAVGAATVSELAVGVTHLRFEPSAVLPGDYTFDVGTAGSATLVLQTILLPLLTADGPSRIEVRGGTHNPGAPPFEFFERTYLGALRAMGAQVTATLLRHGFYPAGGGAIVVDVEPVPKLTSRDWLERGALRSIQTCALVSNLSPRIGRREVQVVASTLRGVSSARMQDGEVREVASPGAGNVVLVLVESEAITEVFTGFGQRSLRAEAVARGAADRAEDYIARDVPVGVHLTDQLLLPMTLAGGGVLRSGPLTPHTRTHMDVLRAFIDVSFSEETDDEESWRVDISV